MGLAPPRSLRPSGRWVLAVPEGELTLSCVNDQTKVLSVVETHKVCTPPQDVHVPLSPQDRLRKRVGGLLSPVSISLRDLSNGSGCTNWMHLTSANCNIVNDNPKLDER
jgi:hypothetical protein